jgi:hypothetical protein
MTLAELEAVESRPTSPDGSGGVSATHRRNLQSKSPVVEWSTSEELGISDARDLLDWLESRRVTRKEVTLTESGRMRVRWVA